MPRKIAHRILAKIESTTFCLGQWFDDQLVADLVAKGCLQLGVGSYGLRYRTISGASPDAKVSIGSYCSFAPGVEILAKVEHPIHFPSTYPFKSRNYWREIDCAGGDGPKRANVDAATRGPIVIGHDVWIGQRAIILSGVTIGTGAIVGAGAVITRNLPPYSVAVGNPGRVVNVRFDEPTIEQLLLSQWWTLPEKILSRLMPFFYSDDIDSFIYAVAEENSQRRSKSCVR